MSRKDPKMKRILFGYIMGGGFSNKCCAFNLFPIAMAVCLFKQTLGTKPKKPTTVRIRISNVLTPLRKKEMDFQNFSLIYAEETDQINGVKCKRNRYYFLFCVKYLGPE